MYFIHNNKHHLKNKPYPQYSRVHIFLKESQVTKTLPSTEDSVTDTRVLSSKHFYLVALQMRNRRDAMRGVFNNDRLLLLLFPQHASFRHSQNRMRFDAV